VGEPEAIHYVLLEKLDNLLLNDFGGCTVLTHLVKKSVPSHIKPPLHEGSRTAKGVEVST